jgi:hypothetical protein
MKIGLLNREQIPFFLKKEGMPKIEMEFLKIAKGSF